MKYLITGGCGFLGSNLAKEVLIRGEQLFILDNLTRYGSTENLTWLKQFGKFEMHIGDIRNRNDIETIIKKIRPDYIFHLSGQVAMTTSIQNPLLDFETNALGTFHLLESVRKFSPESIILYSSTNKVYGDFNDFHFIENNTRYICKEYPEGFPESLTLNFHSPYGCSKGTADQYLLDYNRIFNLKTIVFRHSSMYGTNQYSTYDQGWIGWFCQKALEIKKNCLDEEIVISGTGKQVRDVLNSKDVINLYFKAKDCAEGYGNAFNIGGGIENSLSLIELFNLLENSLNIKFKYGCKEWRQSDQKVFVANNSKAKEILKWEPLIKYTSGIDEMLQWLSKKNITN